MELLANNSLGDHVQLVCPLSLSQKLRDALLDSRAQVLALSPEREATEQQMMELTELAKQAASGSNYSEEMLVAEIKRIINIMEQEKQEIEVIGRKADSPEKSVKASEMEIGAEQDGCSAAMPILMADWLQERCAESAKERDGTGFSCAGGCFGVAGRGNEGSFLQTTHGFWRYGAGDDNGEEDGSWR